MGATKDRAAELWGARAAFWREAVIECRAALDDAGAFNAERNRDYAIMAACHFGGAEHDVAPDSYPPSLPLRLTRDTERRRALIYVSA